MVNIPFNLKMHSDVRDVTGDSQVKIIDMYVVHI
jgi:hypothetical protein